MTSQRGQRVNVAGAEPRGFAVEAEIEFGQWVGRCACGEVEMVDPDEPIFFCFGCGNRSNNGYLRPVIFPAERAMIEQLVLQRPVDDARGLDDLDRAYQAKPLLFAEVLEEDGQVVTLPLTRSWTPNESVEDLINQNGAVYAWQESLKAQGR